MIFGLTVVVFPIYSYWYPAIIFRNIVDVFPYRGNEFVGQICYKIIGGVNNACLSVCPSVCMYVRLFVDNKNLSITDKFYNKWSIITFHFPTGSFVKNTDIGICMY